MGHAATSPELCPVGCAECVEQGRRIGHLLLAGGQKIDRTCGFLWIAPSCAAREEEVKPTAVLSDEQYATCHRAGIWLQTTAPAQQNFASVVYNMERAYRKAALVLYCITL